MSIIQITLAERNISLSIRRHSRARRISLRLSAARDGIIMTLPVRASVASGLKFFTSKADWVLAHVEEGSALPFTDGALLPIMGETYVVRRMEGRGVTQLATGTLPPELRVYGAPEFTARRVREFLKKILREYCFPRAAAMAESLGKSLRDIRIRDTRSRWGSCSAKGSLTFHWQLIFAPPAIVNYLIAHEVAHLLEMNHSVRFWQVVCRLCPDYQATRKWLRREGHNLHRYGK